MKSVFLIVLLLAFAGYFYFQQKPQQPLLPENGPGTDAQPVAVKQESKPEPQPVSRPMTQEGVGQAGQAAAKTPERRIAPDGTFYTIQRISVMTDAGVFSVLPGTKVTVVRPGPPLHVTDGKQQFDVTPEQVTNDLDVANRVYKAYVQQQSQVGSVARTPQPALDGQAMEVARQNAAKGEADTRKSQAILELRSRLGVVARKEAAAEKLAADIRNAFNSNGRITYNGKHPTIYELNAVESDLSRINYERREIENKIIELQQ